MAGVELTYRIRAHVERARFCGGFEGFRTHRCFLRTEKWPGIIHPRRRPIHVLLSNAREPAGNRHSVQLCMSTGSGRLRSTVLRTSPFVLTGPGAESISASLAGCPAVCVRAICTHGADSEPDRGSREQYCNRCSSKIFHTSSVYVLSFDGMRREFMSGGGGDCSLKQRSRSMLIQWVSARISKRHFGGPSRSQCSLTGALTISATRVSANRHTSG